MTMRCAVVTGAASGIGAATARELAHNGYAVSVVDRNLDDARTVANEIQCRGGTAEALYVDVTDEASIEVMIHSVVEHFEQLDVLVNNAGVNFRFTVEDCSTETFDQAMSVNFKGHYLCSRYAIPHLKQSLSSCIINVASTHAFRTQPSQFPYNAAKAAIVGLTQSLVVDLAPYNIRTNTVMPGLIQTGIAGPEYFAPDSPFMQKVLPYHPVGRIGQPEDIAHAIAFLASEKASFINGVCLVIDGGRSALTYSLDGP